MHLPPASLTRARGSTALGRQGHFAAVVDASGRRLARRLTAGLAVTMAGLTLLGLALLATPAAATPLTLTGDYLQVGISDYGTFGSDGNTEPGLLHDPTGTRNFSPGGIPNDYLTPGSPHDGFSIHSTETGLVGNDNSGTSTLGFTSPTLLTGAAAEGFNNAATWTSTYGSSLSIRNSYFFNNGDEQIRVVTIITALSNLTNVGFTRSEDPDPDVNRYGTYDTINTRGDAHTAASDLVSAAGQNTGLTIGILNRSGNTYLHNTEISSSCCTTDDPYTVLANTDTLAYPATNVGDFGLQMAWNLGSLVAGQSVEVDYSYVFGTNQSTVSSATPSAAINTTDGDLAPNVFSLGSAAATAGTVVFDGGILRMQGGSFAGNIVTAPVTINATNGTVDTSTGNGGFSGVVSGPGSLTLIGGGSFVLTGLNTYSGGTFITAGTLAAGTSTALGTGTVTFGGGALQAAADGLSLANAASLASNGTIDTQAFGLTYAGAIGGTGQLTKIGTGTLTLTAANTYGGGTVLTAGTVAVGNNAALGTGTVSFAGGKLQAAADGLTIANAASLTGPSIIDTQTFGLTYAGVIAGAGQLTKVGAGTLTLTAANTYTGGTALQGGILAIGAGGALGTGPLAMDDGTTLRFIASGLTLSNAIALTGVADPTIDTGSGSQTIGGAITGSGALTKTGSGTLDLTGTDTYSGATTVAQGTLLVDGALVNSIATIGSGASLGGHGSVAGLVVGNGAILAPATGTGLTVTGNVTFLTGSAYQATINGDGTNSTLKVAGSTTLGGATLSLLAGPGTIRAGTYTLLTAAGGVNGTFGSLTAPSSLALLDPTLAYGANDVLLTLRLVNFRAIAATPNEAATGGAIEALGSSSALYNAVVGQTRVGAQQAFASASGVSHASSTSIIETTTRFTSGLVIDRLWDVSGSGLSAQEVLRQFAPDQLPTLVRCYGPVVDPKTAVPPQTYTAWGEGFGSFGHSDAGPNAGALDRSLGGFILGIDTPLSGVFGNAWRGGVAGGYTDTTYTSHLDGGTGTVQGVYGSLYGGARYGSIDIRVGTTIAGNFVDARRTVAFPGFREAERSYNSGYSVQTFGEVGYRIAAAQAVIEPVAGAAFLHTSQDGFTEKGGAAALTVAPVDNDLGTTTLGVRGEIAPFQGVPLVAHGFLGWQHVIGDVSPTTTLAFAAAPANTFSVNGTPIDRDALAAALSVDYRVNTALDIGLSYDGLIGATASENGVKGRVEYKF